MDQAQTALPAEALRLRDAVSRRLHDVYHVQIPRLSECKDVSEYETELHETLQRIASLVQQMADDIDDAESAAERAALKTLVDTNRHELMRVRQASRRALLAAHRATASRQEASARSALLSHAARQNSGVRAAPMDRASATSEQVTGALQRTVKLMSSELEKSGYSTQLLTESSETIAQVSNKYASFNDLLRDSVSMIRSNRCQRSS
jgi:protein transport protein SEC20